MIDFFEPRGSWGNTLADYIDATGDCWIWTGAHSANGYGRIWDGTRVVAAHRLVYENLVGPIPDGLEMDHLCRVPACVNPDHLEPVTAKENNRRGAGHPNGRKLRCIHGHLLSGENIRITPQGYRDCLTCQRRRQVEWRARQVPGESV